MYYILLSYCGLEVDYALSESYSTQDQWVRARNSCMTNVSEAVMRSIHNARPFLHIPT